MNKKILENYTNLAQRLGLYLDAENGVIYGNRSGYDILIAPADSQYPYLLTTTISANRPGTQITKEDAKAFRKENKNVQVLKQDNYVITMTVKLITNQDKLKNAYESSLNALLNYLHTRGYENCCQTCGKVTETKGYNIGSSRMLLCQDCFTVLSQKTTATNNEKAARKNNLVGGIVGALLGSLIGVASIIILSQLGYVAAISGIIMAICTLKGYELLGGKLNALGIIICSVLMIVMVYVGDRLDWAIYISRELETDIFQSFKLVPVLLEAELIEMSDYIAALAQVYIFTLVGAIPTIYSAVKNKSSEGRIGQIGA